MQGLVDFMLYCSSLIGLHKLNLSQQSYSWAVEPVGKKDNWVEDFTISLF